MGDWPLDARLLLLGTDADGTERGRRNVCCDNSRRANYSYLASVNGYFQS